MDTTILTYLRDERLCVLSVLLEGSQPYGAAVHYSFEESPLKIFIQTSGGTTKALPFLNGGSGKAAITIGFDEQKWLALQMKGEMKMVSPEDVDRVSEIHYAKHPGAKVHRREDTIFLEFVPTEWKYTDFNTTPITMIKETNE